MLLYESTLKEAEALYTKEQLEQAEFVQRLSYS